MSSSDFKIIGAKELDKALKQIGPKFEKRIAKGAIRAGARVISKQAKENAPKKSGALRKSIQIVARRSGDAVVSIVTRSGAKFIKMGRGTAYAHIIEFGSKDRAATPFLRPALDSKAKDAIKAISTYIQKRLSKLAAEVR